jgi:amino acid adenylation domain-containing protein
METKAPHTPDDLADARQRLLAQLLAEEGLSDSTAEPSIAPRGGSAEAPVTFAQEVLWLLDRATPGLTAYNTPVARRIRGVLDVAALERALNALVARHETLRTVFAARGDGAVQVVKPSADVRLTMHDLRSLPAVEREGAAIAALRADTDTPFDLTQEPGFRASLARVGEEDHVLLLLTHHIVSDAWSYGVMMRELNALYAAESRGVAPDLPPVALQFGDFAAWQRDVLQGERLNERLSYWRERLADLPTLDLPTDFTPRGTTGFAGARVGTTLSPELSDAARRFAQSRDATLYMVLLAAVQSVLHRYSGQDDVVVGSAVAGRTRRESEEMIGYFSQALPMRTSFDGDPAFGELIGRVRDTVLGAFEHQDVPVETLMLELQRSQQRQAPLFRVVLTMQDAMPVALELRGTTAEPVELDASATKFDLTFLVTDTPAGIEIALWYRTELFRADSARRLLGHLETLLGAALADPMRRVSALPLATIGEHEQLVSWNATGLDEGEPTSLVALFEAQAARVPDRVAVVAPSASASAHGSVAGSTTLTYAELNARANQLARHLQASGVAAGAPVGLLLDRSADALVGLLGILKAEGAYMPLSVDAPSARLAQQITESGAKLVVTSASLAGRLLGSATVVPLDSDAVTLGAHSDANLPLSARPRDTAYVLFTSGSTGVPKGVAVTHANIVHYMRVVRRVLGTVDDEPMDGRARQFGLASTLAADLGNTSLFPALLGGATLHLLGADVTTEPARFAQYMSVHQLDVLKLTPNHLRALVAGKSGAELAEVLPRQVLVLGGEALSLDFARQLAGSGRCRVLNHYGPTETTVGVLTHAVTPDSLAAATALGAATVPLGRPLANTRAYVVDAKGQEQPVGIPGELWLGGAGVTNGYLNRPELTAERFVSFRGERVYRTGDRVRRLADGTLEFLGRGDDQVKVRGYRVELGEIEQVLRAHPGVEQGIVLLRAQSEAVEPVLVAYAVPKQAGYAVSHTDRATTEKLSAWLAAQLPEYMVPSAVVLLEALPLTANGKVDRSKLPEPGESAAAGDTFVAPRTETERQLATIWQEVLKREQVGVTDNFLALGGHSLLAIRVLGRISKTFGVRLPLRALFETPTIEALAGAIDVMRAG